jgi:subtilisin family serine protease
VDGKAKSISPQVLAQAIRDAVDVYGADIINVSLGIQKNEDAVREAAEYANRQGVLIISAAGNDGADGPLYYPAAYPTVLGVGSHDKNGKLSAFSQQNGTADLLAPGEDIWMASRNGAVYGAKGTSYATAHVSAAAALLLVAEPGLTPEQLCQALYARAADIGEPGWDTLSGWGILRLPAT